MNNIESYNHKYNTLESLLTSKGDFNTAVFRREWFKELDIYNRIIDETECLNIFEGINFSERFNFLYYKMEIKYCPKCGKPYVYFKKSQRSFTKCNHRMSVPVGLYGKLRNDENSLKRGNFLELLKNKNMFLTNEEYDQKIEDYFNKAKNFTYQLSEKNNSFFHDLILKTENIIPFDITNINISERLYIEKYNLKQRGNCIYCGKETYFLNRINGYCKTCHKHSYTLNSEIQQKKNKDMINSLINHQKYEVIDYPKRLYLDSFHIRCKRCGEETTVSIRSGELEKLSDRQLCHNCEYTPSKMEDELYKFIKERYNGEIIHKSGSRKIIPPYELDIYIPDKKIAIEFDGLYFHSVERGKDMNYHLNKTDMCRMKGIELIHVFENEWINSKEQVFNRILDIMGMNRKVNLCSCNIVEIERKDVKNFEYNNNFMFSKGNYKSIGLIEDGKIISMLTFKLKDNSIDIINMSVLIGIDSKGILDLFSDYMKNNYGPNEIFYTVNRRWNSFLSDDSKYILSEIKKPTLWNFSGKLKCNLTIRKKKNDDYSIYDCGNLVYIMKLK